MKFKRSHQTQEQDEQAAVAMPRNAEGCTFDKPGDETKEPRSVRFFGSFVWREKNEIKSRSEAFPRNEIDETKPTHRIGFDGTDTTPMCRSASAGERARPPLSSRIVHVLSSRLLPPPPPSSQRRNCCLPKRKTYLTRRGETPTQC